MVDRKLKIRILGTIERYAGKPKIARIAEELNLERETLKNIIIELRDGDLVRTSKEITNQDSWVSLANGGFFFLENEQNKKYQSILTTATLIVMIFVGLIGVYGTFVASEHGAKVGAESAFNLTKSYLIPNDVALDIFPRLDDPYDLLFSKRSLAAEKDYEWEGMDVCIKNYGRMSTGRVNYGWVNSFSPPCGIEGIVNIEGGNVACVRLCVRDMKAITHGFNESYVMVGLQNLTLEVDCINCKEKSYRTFSICIWENSSGECDKYDMTIG